MVLSENRGLVIAPPCSYAQPSVSVELRNWLRQGGLLVADSSHRLETSDFCARVLYMSKHTPPWFCIMWQTIRAISRGPVVEGKGEAFVCTF